VVLDIALGRGVGAQSALVGAAWGGWGAWQPVCGASWLGLIYVELAVTTA